jgi:PST family polysaccharide transporter
MLLQMVRSKFVAVILGPSGIGLFGLLTSAVNLIATVTGLGINSSGTRQVAAAAGTGDMERISKVVFTLRRTSVALGLLGAAVVFLLHEPIARLTTGSAEYAGAVAVLAVAVLFRTVNGGQRALLRGLRRVGDLAKLRILGAAAGTVIAITLVWKWGLEGVAPAMVAVAGLATLASWWFARRIRISPVRLTVTEIKREVSGLFRLGLAIVVSGVIGSAAHLLMRAILARDLGLDAVGQFQAAVALSLVYVDFILQAMGLDFLPRLTEVSTDNEASNRLINEQSEISMLLAGPGILGVVVFAPIVIPLLYSGRFSEAVQILEWQCLGVLLRVATWPVGFTIQARGLAGTFMATQTFAHLFHVFVFWVLCHWAGLQGVAFAMAVLYAVHLPLIVFLVRRQTGFSWTPKAWRVSTVIFAAYVAVMVAKTMAPPFLALVSGLVILISISFFSYTELSKRLDGSPASLIVQQTRSLLRKINN